MNERELKLPMDDETVRSLKVGDAVSLHGVIVTGRDAVHKWMAETFIRKTRQPEGDDIQAHEAVRPLLNGGAIYHCGPVVARDARGFRFVAAGPTTSMREEPYEAEVMWHFNIKAVIGKGGMGVKTLEACRAVPAVYLHVVGGAASLLAQSVAEVLGAYKTEFGVPETMWVARVESFPAVVTMDAHGKSLHAQVEAASKARLRQLLSCNAPEASF